MPRLTNHAPLLSAIAGAAIAGAGLSLSIPLIALRLEEAGYSGEANGLGVAISGLATLAFAPFVPTLAARFGVRVFMVACLAAAVASLAALAATQSALPFWYPIRGVYSCALAGLFVASEFAVNALAPERRRGTWIGVYSTALAIGFAAGPATLGAVGTQGVAPFVAGAGLFVAAGAPIALGAGLPALPRRSEGSLVSHVLAAPGLMTCAFAFGAIETGAMGLLPVHAVRNGLPAETGAFFVMALALGNVIFQIPLGLVSDRLPRRPLLVAIAAAATAGALALSQLATSPLFAPALVLWAGVASGLYMVGLAALGSRYAAADLAAANAAFVACYACGMIAGPPLAGRAIDLAPRVGLFLSLGGLGALALAVLLARGARRRD